MKKENIWEIMPVNPPYLNKKCTRCNNNTFYCSEKFRMNAQKKNIDVWLIYRCSSCQNIYNMTIFSRTKSALLEKDLFNKFSENNKVMAWEYAFSPLIGQKNKVEIDYGTVEYQTTFEGASLEDVLNFDKSIIVIRINYPFDFNLKLSSLARSFFNISIRQLNHLIEANVISVQNNYLNKKQKVRNGDVVLINIARYKAVCDI